LKVVRGILLACIIGGFAALFFVLSPSRNLIEGQGEAVAPETDEDILLKGLRYSEWEGDRLSWSMKAERTRYHHDQKRATLEAVEVTFFPTSGGKMFLWAELVDYNLETGDLVARESVRGKSDQGYVLVTENLFYDGHKREVSTDDQVTLEKDRLTIQGVGMKGSLADHRFRLLSAVRAVFSPQGAAR
jgi:LPS export ABC transporter protein LptC